MLMWAEVLLLQWTKQLNPQSHFCKHAHWTIEIWGGWGVQHRAWGFINQVRTGGAPSCSLKISYLFVLSRYKESLMVLLLTSHQMFICCLLMAHLIATLLWFFAPSGHSSWLLSWCIHLYTGWWFGICFSIYWESSSQLTNIFQRGGSTTNQIFV